MRQRSARPGHACLVASLHTSGHSVARSSLHESRSRYFSLRACELSLKAWLELPGIAVRTGGALVPHHMCIEVLVAGERATGIADVDEQVRQTGVMGT